MYRIVEGWSICSKVAAAIKLAFQPTTRRKAKGRRGIAREGKVLFHLVQLLRARGMLVLTDTTFHNTGDGTLHDKKLKLKHIRRHMDSSAHFGGRFRLEHRKPDAHVRSS